MCPRGLSGRDAGEAVGLLCERAGVPEALRPRYEALSVVPPDTPLPMSMLRRLWRLGSDTDAEATANLLESKARAPAPLLLLCTDTPAARCQSTVVSDGHAWVDHS